MVNRILIRIKVVQMLYSYLLTRSEFKIDATPETTSKDKKYAYAVYLDLIFLVLELSGLRFKRSDDSMSPTIDVDRLIAGNRVGKALFDNDTIKAIILRGGASVEGFDSLLQDLSDAMVKSSAYRDYKKIKNPGLADDVRFWLTVINTIIAKDERVVAVMRQNEAFTIVGFNTGVRQISDTLTSYQDSRMTYVNAGRELKASLDKAYELYYSLFVLMMELTREQALRLDNAKTKYLATNEDLNPNTRFVDNRFIARLENNEDLKAYLEQHPVSWTDEPSLIRSLLDRILESKIYDDYMNAPADDYAADCDFWRNILRAVILPSDDLAEALETKSIYWNDDLPIMGTFVIKSIKQFASSRRERQVSASVQRQRRRGIRTRNLPLCRRKPRDLPLVYRPLHQLVAMGSRTSGIHGHRGNDRGHRRTDQLSRNTSPGYDERIHRNRQQLQHLAQRPVHQWHTVLDCTLSQR